jgi:hypothetical protein
MKLFAFLQAFLATRIEDNDRGDVPGWVMVTVMSAVLVVAILAAFENPIRDAVTNALDSVTASK